MRQLAYVGEDGQIYVADLDSGTSGLVSAASSGSESSERQVLYNWPTWSPGGDRLAFFRFEAVEGEVRQSGVRAVDADGSHPRDLYRGGRESGPIYMCWSPDGQRLAILVQEAGQLHLRVASLGSAEPPVPVAQGAPLYFVWRPDSRGLVAHVGPDQPGETTRRILWIDLDAGHVEEATLLRPASSGSRAPAWSDRLGGALFAVGDGTEGEIVSQASRASDPATVVGAGAAPAFVLSPMGTALAYAGRAAADSPLYAGLWLYDLAARSARQISDDPWLAFFWCQDGRRLVCATGDVGNRTVALRALDTQTGSQTEMGWFRPTRDVWLLFGHFDQYAHSATILSPTGEEVVLATSQAQERQNGHVPTVRRVLVRSLDDPAREVMVAPGRLACWRPSP